MQGTESQTEGLSRNARLAELSAVAHELLADFAGLPDVHKVVLSPDPIGTAHVSLQLHRGGVSGVALWAQEFGTPVVFRQWPNFVEVRAATADDSFTVWVWDHLTYMEAYALLTGLGVEVEETVEVAPQRVLDHVRMSELLAAEEPKPLMGLLDERYPRVGVL